MKFIRNKYPDGSIYASIDYNTKVEQDRSIRITVNEKINSYEDLWFIRCIKDLLDNMGYKAELIIPSMWEQQADRRFKWDESFGLKLVCDFINSMNFEKVYVYHPHSDVTAALLNNYQQMRSNEFFREVLDDIPQYLNALTILSPDAGAFKWVFNIFETQGIAQNLDIECGAKVRDKDKLINVVNRLDFEGKDVLIVDDICVYGGTFIKIANILKNRNIGNLYLAVVHMTVQNPNKDLETLFKTVYTTNSKFDSYELNNLKIIPR